MKNIAVIFGGNSTEHDISILSAIQIANAIDRQKYNVFPIYITHSGKWLFGKELLQIETYKNIENNQKKLRQVAILPSSQSLFKKSFGRFREYAKIDCAVLSLHGKNGEDGTVQGLLELADIPYTSSGVLASGIGIDKDMMKQVFKQNKIPIIDYVALTKKQFENQDLCVNNIVGKLQLPVIVKPNCLGSSIGITICKTRDEHFDALGLAFLFDEKVVVEKCIENLKEVNISVLGSGEDNEVSETEEVNNKNGLLTFQKKYLSGNSGKAQKNVASSKITVQNDQKPKEKDENDEQNECESKSKIDVQSNAGTKSGMQNLDRIMPANISKKQIKTIESLAKKIFSSLNCKGVVRIDFIIDQSTNKIYANEINTIPGSFAFYLWQNKGIDFSKLADILIEIAIEDSKQKRKLVTKFSSNVF